MSTEINNKRLEHIIDISNQSITGMVDMNPNIFMLIAKRESLSTHSGEAPADG